jgi:hypothetical protein
MGGGKTEAGWGPEAIVAAVVLVAAFMAAWGCIGKDGGGGGKLVVMPGPITVESIL